MSCDSRGSEIGRFNKGLMKFVKKKFNAIYNVSDSYSSIHMHVQGTLV